MALLELKDISMQFGGLKAVNRVNFKIDSNEIMSLIGPNGAGKTTMFNLITGIYQPTEGDIIFKGDNINKVSPSRRTQLGMARTFQNIRLFKQLTVRDNIVVAMHSRRRIGMVSSVLRLPNFFKERREVNMRAEEFLEYVNMRDVKNERAENLPYGRQRELEILRAIATGAELLLLDEPAAGMNPQETIELMKFIRSIRDDMGKAILLIEHDMTLVMGISDRVAVLDYGKKLVEGLPKDVQKNQKVIDAYLGTGADEDEEVNGDDDAKAK